jgi:fluoroacetyl-CoA thioesterase
VIVNIGSGPQYIRLAHLGVTMIMGDNDGLREGSTYRIEHVVTPEDSPGFLREKGIGILSTPRMISLMEEAARLLIKRNLDDEHTSVGYHVDVYHKAPAPVGSHVIVEARITRIEGRRIDFKVKCMLGRRVIGEGTHTRYIVSFRSFREKIEKISTDSSI